MKKLITILFSIFCFNSLFALTLPGIGKGSTVQDRLIKGGKIGYVQANKGTITETQLIQFQKEVDKSGYKWVIIHLMEDNTALHLIPNIGVITYGDYDRANLCLRNDKGVMSIIGNSTAKEDWPDDILRK